MQFRTLLNRHRSFICKTQTVRAIYTAAIEESNNRYVHIFPEQGELIQGESVADPGLRAYLFQTAHAGPPFFHLSLLDQFSVEYTDIAIYRSFVPVFPTESQFKAVWPGPRQHHSKAAAANRATMSDSRLPIKLKRPFLRGPNLKCAL